MPQITKQETPAKEIASARKNITDQDRQISLHAFSLFKEKKFDDCIKQMKRLLELRSHDSRVSMNKTLAEYLSSKCTKTDEFIKQLEHVKKQVEFGIVSTDDELDDIDRSFFLYNQAVLHYQLKQYKSAINVLDRLYKIIEPLGEILAAKVCMLFVEVYLLNGQLDQAFGMITYIESVILSIKISEGKNERQAELMKMFQPKLHMFKVRLYLTRGFYAQCKRELKLAMSSNNKSNEVLFLKGQVECLSCNFQKSIKLLNSTQKNCHEGNTRYSINTMYQNDLGFVYFCMRKFNLAISHFRKAFEDNSKFIKSLPVLEKVNSLSGRPLETLTMNKQGEIMYNMGVTLLFAGRPSVAFDCLIEARHIYKCNPRYWLRLAECCIAVHQKNLDVKQNSSMYGSFHVREVVGSGVHRKIRLSPIYQHYSKQDTSSAMPATTLEFGSLCLSNASILLPSEVVLEENMTKFLQNEKPIPGDNDKELTRKMSETALRCSYYLFVLFKETIYGRGMKRSFIGRIFVDTPPGDPMQTKEIYYLKASIFGCHAYVGLALGDFFKCESLSRTLLRMSHVTGPQRFMAHMYLAESLIEMGKITEAIQELSVENLKAYQMFDKEVENLRTTAIFPKSLNEARLVMMLNMASTYCCWSEFEKCKLILRQIASAELHPSLKSQAILMSVYCDLQTGKISDALNLIKRSEIFPSGRLIDRVEAARVMSSVSQFPQNIMQQMSLNELAGRKVSGF